MKLHPILKMLCFSVLLGATVVRANASAIILGSPLAPSVFTGAGHFDGSTLYLDVTGDNQASYGSATATANMVVSSNLISASGSASVNSSGQGATASANVWFTLNEPESFTLTTSSTGYVDAFNLTYGELFIYDKNTTYITPITETTGVLDPSVLGPSEVFLISGVATAAQYPATFSAYPTESTFSYTLRLGAAVPVPSSIWLFGSGLIGLVVILRKKLKMT